MIEAPKQGDPLSAAWAAAVTEAADRPRTASEEYHTGAAEHTRSRLRVDPGWLPFRAVEEVPAHAIVFLGAPTGTLPRTWQEGLKPDAATADRIIINGPRTVIANGFGWGHLALDRPVAALYDSATVTPVAGDMLGPKAGAWGLTNGSDFLAIEDADATRETVKVLRWRSSFPVRHGLLRTDLTARPDQSSCIIEERVWTVTDGVKSLKCNAKTYRAFHPRGEYYGTADLGEVDWIIDPSGPTAAELDVLGITLPAGAPEPTETEIASIIDISCPDFAGQCDNAP